MRVADVDEAVLRDAVAQATSWADVKRACGIGGGGAVHRALRRRVAALGLSVAWHGRARTTYDDETLRVLVAKADSLADVLRALGLAQAGGTHAHLGRRVRALGLDTSHWTRRRRAMARTRPLTSQAVLVRRPDAERRRPGAVLARALVQTGRPYLCTGCGTGGTWEGRPLVLHVDHVDGDWRNDDAGNLRFLCPNCHSQTATWCRKLSARPS